MKALRAFTYVGIVDVDEKLGLAVVIVVVIVVAPIGYLNVVRATLDVLLFVLGALIDGANSKDRSSWGRRDRAVLQGNRHFRSAGKQRGAKQNDRKEKERSDKSD